MHYSLQEDLMNHPAIRDRIKRDKSYAQNWYAAMCNNEFIKQDVWTVLADQEWSCSWRAAGGIIATLRDQGEDYMDYYCSGLGGFATHEDPGSFYEETSYVHEGIVTEEIQEHLKLLGWAVRPITNNND